MATINGTSGNDTLTASSGDDTITPGNGNDTIDGVSGTDTVVFGSARSNYSITQTFTGYEVKDTVGSTGTKTISNVFYKNVLGRAEGADAGGLSYWNGKLADGSSTRWSLAQDILASAHTFKGNATYGYVADLLDNSMPEGGMP
jgi:Ca2+-binding RTX toxin-like protein